MEPRIVYCKPKSDEFIGSYQSESILFLPESDYVRSKRVCTEIKNNLQVQFDNKYSSITNVENRNETLNSNQEEKGKNIFWK